MEHARGRLRGAVGGASFPTVVAGTSVLVVLTILLGVATKAAGAGLACQARWPLCDGGFLNLFPQSFPSFFEWIHRVVAATVGVGVLASVWLGWRTDAPAGARLAVTLGLALLPVQILLGRETVLQFTLPILTAHFWVAFTIFASFAVATALAWRPSLTPGRLRRAAAAAAALVPVQVLLYPPVVTNYSPPVQTFQYAVTLAVFGVAVAAAVAARDTLDGTPARAALALPVLHPLVVLSGRQLLSPPSPPLSVYGLLAAALVGAFAVVAVGYHRASESLGASKI